MPFTWHCGECDEKFDVLGEALLHEEATGHKPGGSTFQGQAEAQREKEQHAED